MYSEEGDLCVIEIVPCINNAADTVSKNLYRLNDIADSLSVRKINFITKNTSDIAQLFESRQF